jgi:hypothetical protein
MTDPSMPQTGRRQRLFDPQAVRWLGAAQKRRSGLGVVRSRRRYDDEVKGANAV